MDTQTLLITIVVGLVAGWLAGQIVRGYGFGLVGNIVVGVIGSLLATWGLPKLGVAFPLIVNGTVTAILVATLGAVVLLLIVGMVRRAT
jgi:uncharacterized membrane protein YeaQ/YmgE (transglycosylase-associated protein family)